MADAVAAALREKRHLMVEAGTGVGKSFAYLVPAILAAAGAEAGAGKTIVVSTHTISLQEQILRKDIPFLNSVIPIEFTTVLVKGRRNYLSRRRLAVARARARSLFNEPGEFDELAELFDWSKQTNDGSLSDLVFAPQRAVWDEVASDHGNCMGRNCPEFTNCFYYRERQRMRHAQLLIVNHALLFSDLAPRARRASLLPDYDAVIIDEAHTIPATAGDHLGLGVSSGQVEYALTRLYNDRTNKGLLVHNHCQTAELAVERCRVVAEEFFDDIQEWYESHPRANGRVTRPRMVKNRLSSELDRLAQLVRVAGQSLPPEQKQDFLAAANRVSAIAEELDVWLDQPDDGFVHWIDVTRSRSGRARIQLQAAPVDVGSCCKRDSSRRSIR